MPENNPTIMQHPDLYPVVWTKTNDGKFEAGLVRKTDGMTIWLNEQQIIDLYDELMDHIVANLTDGRSHSEGE